MEWPVWWRWELEITSHVRERMEDRDFTEVDLRDMMDRAVGRRLDFLAGRWAIRTSHGRRSWEVIVEPDHENKVLVIITAYPITR